MGLAARVILFILIALSVWSVGIMFDRRQAFRSESGTVNVDELKKLIRSKNWGLVKSWSESNPSFIAGAAAAALEAADSENDVSAKSEKVDRAVQSFIADRRLSLEKGLNVLATLAANAAFIGLLGTVLGIIQSFGILSSQQGSAMNAVMFGLAEALVATALGIFVAVPAAVAYNYYGQRIRRMSVEAQSVRDLMISRL